MKINFDIYKKLHPQNNTQEYQTETNNSYTSTKEYQKNIEILQLAANTWYSLDDFRKKGTRCGMYCFGNQWGDYIKDYSTGKWVTEENYIKSQGKVPLKNNIIRSMVRSVLGQFSNTQTEPVVIARDRDDQSLGETMSLAIQTNYQRNNLWELDRRNYEYFLITGAAFFRTYYSWKDTFETYDVWTDIVNYNRIFFDSYMEDIRHWDVSLIGQIHDISLNDILAQFSQNSIQNAKRLKHIYRHTDKQQLADNLENLTGTRYKNMDFFHSNDNSRCRVIEIWRKEAKESLRVHDRLTGEYYKVDLNEEANLIQENQNRILEQSAMGILEQDMKLVEYEWFISNDWNYYYLSPYGDVLAEGETPYWHRSHPFSFKIYPFFNSESHSLVEDAIDQNRYINRLITMQDFIMGASAKGVLMFPETAKPDNMSMDEIAEQWVAYNGIIYYKPIPGIAPPQQIIANSSQSGVYDMLKVQLQLFKDTTGVYGALQGQAPPSGTPASLYYQQTQNSATNLVDISEAYRQLREDRDTKIMKLQQQYYTEGRYLNIAGTYFSKKAQYLNPEKVRNVIFDLSITESLSTPTYRMAQNELLIKLLEMGQINIEMVLENGAFPFADKLLMDIKAYKEELKQQQQQLIEQQEQLNPHQTQENKIRQAMLERDLKNRNINI